MRGKAIVGFGRRHLRYASGRELDWMVIGFSPRKASTTIHLSDRPDVDAAVLEDLVTRSVEELCLGFRVVCPTCGWRPVHGCRPAHDVGAPALR